MSIEISTRRRDLFIVRDTWYMRSLKRCDGVEATIISPIRANVSVHRSLSNGFAAGNMTYLGFNID